MHKLAQSCVQIAEEKGFDRCTWESFPSKIAFVLSEIDEAQEAMVANDLAEIGAEFADIAIRTLIVLETLCPDWSDGRITHRRLVAKHVFEPPEVMLWPMIRCARQALSYWRDDQHKDVQLCLEFLLLELWRLADRLELDLNTAVEAKRDRNKLRPMYNGRKRSGG